MSRTAIFSKIHKVLKKHYKPVRPNLDRPVLEQLLFACCLENAHYQQAEEAFESLSATFFDWNEVRVSTLSELAEAMQVLPEPAEAANRLKRVLQSTFESIYAFELEDLRKENLGPAVARLKKIDGTTPFSVNYVVQTCLGGHAIPIDQAAFEALQIVGALSESEAKAGHAPGLERAIPKTKGLEFASLLHQLAADFAANRYSSAVHKILLEIEPEAKERLPRRTRKRPAKAAAKDKAEAASKTKAAKPKAAAKKGAAKKPAAKKTASTASASKRAPTKKKTTAKKAKATPKKKTKAKTATKKKTHTSRLSKRKPR